MLYVLLCSSPGQEGRGRKIKECVCVCVCVCVRACVRVCRVPGSLGGTCVVGFRRGEMLCGVGGLTLMNTLGTQLYTLHHLLTACVMALR